MRTSSATAILLVLAACSAEKDAAAPGGSPSAAAGKADEGPETIECALHGAAAFARECVVERAPHGSELYLVVRHPDGAFRRFKVLKDGRGVAVADGAEEAVTSISNGVLEAAVGKDRYRFPAMQQKRHEPTS